MFVRSLRATGRSGRDEGSEEPGERPAEDRVFVASHGNGFSPLVFLQSLLSLVLIFRCDFSILPSAILFAIFHNFLIF